MRSDSGFAIQLKPTGVNDVIESYFVCGIKAPETTKDVFVERFGRSVCVGAYEEFDTRLIDPFHIVRVEAGFKFFNRPAEVFGNSARND